MNDNAKQIDACNRYPALEVLKRAKAEGLVQDGPQSEAVVAVLGTAFSPDRWKWSGNWRETLADNLHDCSGLPHEAASQVVDIFSTVRNQRYAATHQPYSTGVTK